MRPQDLDGDLAANAILLDLGAVHLGDRGGGHCRAEACKHIGQRAFQRGGDDRFGLGLRERRQLVLQAFEVARHLDADHVGPRRQHLAELDIGRAEPGQRPRQPRAGLGIAALDQPRHAQHEAQRRRQRLRIDHGEGALAGNDKGCAGQAQDMRDRGNHKRQPECSATMPPDIAWWLTRAKPAARIISVKTFGLGNCRIDSTR